MSSERENREKFAAREAEAQANSKVAIEPDRSPLVYAINMGALGFVVLFALSSIAVDLDSIVDELPTVLVISVLIGAVAFLKERSRRGKWQKAYDQEYQRILSDMDQQ